MSCPEGQYYSVAAKRCLRENARPGSKGRSMLPCPENKVWNPNPAARRCVLKSLFKKVYGEAKANAASLEQRRLRALTKKVKTPVLNITVNAKRSANAITPALKQSFALQTAKLRKDAVMPPGLDKGQMVSWVKTNCKNQEDPILMDPYEESSAEDLMGLVRLGSGFCYTSDSLDNHVKSSIERKIPIKDMINPSYRLDAADFGALETAALRSNKAYRLPLEPSEKPALHYKLFIGGSNPTVKMVFMFDERKVKKTPGGGLDYSNAIPDGGWIGYIPAKGTAELERLIREAFARGRLFVQATRPFKCCRFHLKKTIDYWSSQTEAKIDALVSEIRDLI
jgi:hypothetical protein